jgi:hypothetical protein
MPRILLPLLTVSLLTYHVMAADSLQVTVPQAPVADTVYVIPAGPVAGSFTPSARVAVVDTIAGWAKVQIEGWVPVGAVMDRLETPPGPFQPANLIEKSSKKKDYHQCEAITRKGTRCTRRAIGTTRYCWQHTRK